MKNISNHFKTLAVAGGMALGSASALADTSSPAEYRGYSKCLEAAAAQSRGLAADRFYLLNAEGTDRQYFINATRWQDGDRVPVRIACETSRSGRVLLSQSIAEGRFTSPRGQVRIEVAER